MTDEELIEQVARAIWEQQCQHWGRYRDQLPALCSWDELTQSKRRELMREAQAAIAAMEPRFKAERIRGGEMVKEAAAQDAETWFPFDTNKRYPSFGVVASIRALSVPAIVEAGEHQPKENTDD